VYPITPINWKINPNSWNFPAASPKKKILTIKMAAFLACSRIVNPIALKRWRKKPVKQFNRQPERQFWKRRKGRVREEFSKPKR